MTDRRRGSVRNIVRAKGFAFITPDDGGSEPLNIGGVGAALRAQGGTGQ